ncbi:hypothetical protein COOONC_27292 [Cooperia oncophora]
MLQHGAQQIQRQHGASHALSEIPRGYAREVQRKALILDSLVNGYTPTDEVLHFLNRVGNLGPRKFLLAVTSHFTKEHVKFNDSESMRYVPQADGFMRTPDLETLEQKVEKRRQKRSRVLRLWAALSRFQGRMQEYQPLLGATSRGPFVLKQRTSAVCYRSQPHMVKFHCKPLTYEIETEISIAYVKVHQTESRAVTTALARAQSREIVPLHLAIGGHCAAEKKEKNSILDPATKNGAIRITPPTGCATFFV